MKSMSRWFENLVIRWSRPNKERMIYDSFILFILYLLSWFAAYYTGGSKYSYVHTVYIPVIYAALLFKIPGGFLGGIVAGIVMGPIMPLDAEIGVMQSFSNWFIRMLFFVVIGTIAGIIFEILSSQFNRIERLAYFDSVAELPNKICLQRRLEGLINGNNGKKNFGIITLVVENYLDILDVIGYDLTDYFWFRVARYINNHLPENVSLYYFDNNTYQILLEGFDEGRVEKWTEHFSEFLNYPINISGIPIYLKCRLGCAFYPKHGSTAEEVMQKSFIAMDKARTRGLGHLCYQETLTEKSKENFLLLGEVKEALEKEEFVLYYQPKYNLLEEKIFGVEALIRWNHPRKGMMSPGEFIPEMENTDLINLLTYWVMERALSDYSEWKEKGITLNVSINISSHNLQHYRFLEEVDRIIAEYAIGGPHIELEITETDIMTENKVLDKLLERGFRISIDDFGTGYSSLAYLKYLPADTIKIDRGFIGNITENGSDREIVKAVIKMGHALGKSVLAEGVETEEALELLKEMGCDSVQGYYISRPVPKERIIDLLQQYSQF